MTLRQFYAPSADSQADARNIRRLWAGDDFFADKPQRFLLLGARGSIKRAGPDGV